MRPRAGAREPGECEERCDVEKHAGLPLYTKDIVLPLYIIHVVKRPLNFAPCLHPARGPKRIGSAGRTQESLRAARMGMLRRRASAWPHAQNALARSRLQPPTAPEARLFA